MADDDYDLLRAAVREALDSPISSGLAILMGLRAFTAKNDPAGLAVIDAIVAEAD